MPTNNRYALINHATHMRLHSELKELGFIVDDNYDQFISTLKQEAHETYSNIYLIDFLSPRSFVQRKGRWAIDKKDNQTLGDTCSEAIKYVSRVDPHAKIIVSSIRDSGNFEHFKRNNHFNNVSYMIVGKDKLDSMVFKYL